MSVIVPRPTDEDFRAEADGGTPLQAAVVLLNQRWKQEQLAAIYKAIGENYIACEDDGRLCETRRTNEVLLAMATLLGT
jgi:hypothetical protein